MPNNTAAAAAANPAAAAAKYAAATAMVKRMKDDICYLKLEINASQARRSYRYLKPYKTV